MALTVHAPADLEVQRPGVEGKIHERHRSVDTSDAHAPCAECGLPFPCPTIQIADHRR
jgi:hypothetical protein